MADRIVDAATLQAQTTRIFERLGVPAADALIVADHLVEADLRGHPSHGVIRVPSYVTACHEGRINPRPNIQIVEDHGGQS